MPCSGATTPPDDLFYRLAHRKLCGYVDCFKDAARMSASSVSDTLRTTSSVAESDSIML